jgi:hypothetical protein
MFTESAVGLLEEEDFKRIWHTASRCWNPDPTITVNSFGSEQQIASHLRALFEDLIYAAGLSGKVRVLMERAVYETRPDMWIITTDGIPCGSAEVKTPGKGKVDVMSNTYVLGEVYDALMQMPNFYGKELAIGVLMTGEEFRVCWIGRDDKVDMAAPEKLERMSSAPATPRSRPPTTLGSPTTRSSGSEGSEGVVAPKAPSPPTPSKMKPETYAIEEDTEINEPAAASGADTSADADDDSPSERHINVSQVVSYTDDGGYRAMRLLISAMMKMSHTRTIPYVDVYPACSNIAAYPRSVAY